jgi:hypothetical protein
LNSAAGGSALKKYQENLPHCFGENWGFSLMKNYLES